MTNPVPLETLLADAERFAKASNGVAPTYSSEQYEDAMLSLAEHEARKGETTGAALSRLLTDRDARLAALGKAAYLAETAELVTAEKRAAEQVAALRKAHGVDSEGAEPAHGSKDHILAVMTQFAALAKRNGETVEQCWSRLLAEEPTFRGAYGAYLDAAV